MLEDEALMDLLKNGMPKTTITRESQSCQGNRPSVKTVFAMDDEDNNDAVVGNSDNKPTAA